MVAATNAFLGALLFVVSTVLVSVSAFRTGMSRDPKPSLSLSRNRDRSILKQSLDGNDESSPAFWSPDQPQNRRDVFRNVVSVALAGTMVATTTSTAANAAVPTPSELERLRKGHARIQYMLNNWDEVTQVCKNNSDQANKQVVRTDGGDKCERTPLNVQIYMGYKSTEDPLYKADKLMVRATPLVKDGFDEADYLEAVENYKEKADNTAMMAYTSSWGEANPNGGKDVIDDYLEKTRLDVVSSEKSLRKILMYLGLEPLPASKNP